MDISKLDILSNLVGGEIIDKISNDFHQNTYEIGKWTILEGEKIKYIYLDSSNYVNNLFEYHEKYTDIHWVLKGIDIMYFGDSDVAIISQAYNSEFDYGLSESSTIEEVVLEENSYRVVKPGIIHSNKLENNSIKVVIKLYE